MTKDSGLGKPSQGTELSKSSGQGAVETYSQDAQYFCGQVTPAGYALFLVQNENPCCNYPVPAPSLYIGMKQKIKSCHIWMWYKHYGTSHANREKTMHYQKTWIVSSMIILEGISNQPPVGTEWVYLTCSKDNEPNI